MVSGRFVALCATGMAGSLFLGYCVYFDKKRRCDPDYKKKVLASEQAIYCEGSLLSVATDFIPSIIIVYEGRNVV